MSECIELVDFDQSVDWLDILIFLEFFPSQYSFARFDLTIDHLFIKGVRILLSVILRNMSSFWVEFSWRTKSKELDLVVR